MRSAHSRKRGSPVIGARRVSVWSRSPFTSAPASGSRPKALSTGACRMTAAVMSTMR